MAPTEDTAFPRLTIPELALVKPLAKPCDYADGDIVFRAGQPDIDLYVVESGRMEIRNFIGAEPAAEWLPAAIVRDAKGFVLTGTDVIASAYGRGRTASRARWKRVYRAS